MADPIQFIETDTATIQDAAVVEVQSELGRTLYAGDPVRLVALAFSYVQAVFASAANDAANQSFLDRASGSSLDALGALVGIIRLTAASAACTLRFSLGAARSDVVLVPAGTRATCAGSGILFATIADAQISAGQTYVDVIANAQTAGIVGNGFLVGDIATMADSVLWIASVTNTTATSGGSDPETDANLAERIRLAPTTFSVAGPEDAYIALTQGSRPDVESVSVNNSAPRVIDIYFTLTGGQIPSSDVIAEVSGYLNDKYRRPMSDVVNVRAPTTTTYTINLAYYIATADSARATAIQNAVTQAVADYVTWQQGAIGRDVNPSELIRRVMDAGALRVNITSPTYAAIDFAHLAVPASGQTVAFEGIVDP